jgi:hypothetical protein
MGEMNVEWVELGMTDMPTIRRPLRIHRLKTRETWAVRTYTLQRSLCGRDVFGLRHVIWGMGLEASPWLPLTLACRSCFRVNGYTSGKIKEGVVAFTLYEEGKLDV